MVQHHLGLNSDFLTENSDSDPNPDPNCGNSCVSSVPDIKAER